MVARGGPPFPLGLPPIDRLWSSALYDYRQRMLRVELLTPIILSRYIYTNHTAFLPRSPARPDSDPFASPTNVNVSIRGIPRTHRM